MIQRTHVDTKTLGDVFSSLFQNLEWKVIGSFFGIILSWIFEGDHTILISIYSLILVDTFTGVWLAAKNKELSSRGFYRTVVKCFVYFIMIAVGRVVDKHTPIAFAAPIMDSFLVMTEAFSIFENFSKLNFPVPTKLLKLLKIYYDKKDDKK